MDKSKEMLLLSYIEGKGYTMIEKTKKKLTFGCSYKDMPLVMMWLTDNDFEYETFRTLITIRI